MNILEKNLHWQNTIDNIDWEEVSLLYKRAPLGDRPAEHLQKAFSNSTFTYFVFEEQQLIGVGRALADGVDCAYLCDIAILPTHQKQGIGKAIVQKLLDATQGHRKVILYAAEGKESFYKQFDFCRMRTAMARFKYPELALKLNLIEP